MVSEMPGSTAPAVIEVRGLDNRFGAQYVHQGLDLDVRRGEILGVVGGSGTGKSVLLRSIVGLQAPAAGSIRIQGQDLLKLRGPARTRLEQRFGILFQKGALYSSLTVTENVALPLIEHAGLPRALAEHLARSKLALAGLPADAGDKYPASLSGGMIKRAALARALALDAGILFLDEPTAGLDPVSSRRFDDLILELRESLGGTVVVVTHELASIFAIGDEAVFLDSEQHTIIARGNPKTLLAESRDATVRAFLTRGEPAAAR